MPNGATTTEEQRMMNLEQARRADEVDSQNQQRSTATTPKHFIGSGEFAIFSTFLGVIEIAQLLLDFIPFIGWVVNVVISLFIGLIFYFWLNGKINKGAPKKWYKAIYAGAGGSIIPIIPGYFGAIMYLYIQDHKLLGKIGKAMGDVTK